MTVRTLAAEAGVDPSDVEVIARWLTADEALDHEALELELRAVLDPAGQRTARLASRAQSAGGCRARTSSSSAGTPAAAAATRRRTAAPTTVGAGKPSTNRRSTRSGAATRRSGSVALPDSESECSAVQ